MVADPDATGDAGVPYGTELLAFATAAQRGSEALPAAREGVRAALGDDGLLEAAATVSVFNGLVRVADGTGIQLDDGVAAYTADFRGRLGINRFLGGRNTVGSGGDRDLPDDVDVRSLFH